MRARSLLVLGALAAWPLLGSSPGSPAGAAAHREGLLRVGSRSFSVLGDSVVEVGRTSHHCLACHDGTVASEAFSVSRSSFDATPSGGRGHPVDVPYPIWGQTLPARRGAGSAARPVRRLCLVHDVSRRLRRLEEAPLGPNDRSALCLCCHLK